MATDETRYEASNPQTAPSRLQELTSDPELWPLIAANPSAYDSLVAWLGENGGDDVRAAIASRPSAAPGPLPGPTPLPGGPAYAAAPARSGSSNKGLWITLAVLVTLLVGSGIGVGIWALTKDGSSTTTDDDTKDDQKNDDEDDPKDDEDDPKTTEVDCDTLDDLEDAASDLTLYYPEDDESDLADALSTIEEFADVDEKAIADAVEVLLAYGESVQDDPDAVFSDEWEDAVDAEYEISDYVFEEC